MLGHERRASLCNPDGLEVKLRPLNAKIKSLDRVGVALMVRAAEELQRAAGDCNA
jgi:hypothetical protein